MSQNALEDAEVADLFKAGADLKSGDPARMQAFIDRVQPLLEQALEATGKAVPQDLRSQVDAGEMTADAAAEVARARHAAAAAQAHAARVSAQQAATVSSLTRAQLSTHLSTWQAQKQATDPDFALKQDVMKHVAQGIVSRRGQPNTPAQVTAFAEEAYAEATRLLLAARPAAKATRPAPAPNTSPSRTGVNPAPTSMAEIVELALRG
jgi:hypothetical protein